MSEFITLKNDTYSTVLPLDIVAFHYSEPGACGYHGVIRIITKDKRLYMIHYYYDEWSETDLYKVCPVLQEMKIGFCGYNLLPPGWNSVYMGLGNTLFFIDDLKPLIEEKCQGMRLVDIYKSWDSIILEGLE